MSMHASAQKQLRQFIDQLERLEEEKKALAGDIRDKLLEAKALGFDPKIIKMILKLRRKSKSDRQEEEAVLDTYLAALDMLDDEQRSSGDGMDREAHGATVQ